MKKLTLIAALILSSIGVAQADETVEGSTGGRTVIHSVEAVMYINKNGEVQAQAYVSMRTPDGDFWRDLTVVTGCDKEGGSMGKADRITGRIIGKERLWLESGDTVGDGIARKVCSVAFANFKKSGAKVLYRM